MTAVRLPKPVHGLPATKEMEDIDPDQQHINLNSEQHPETDKESHHKKKKKKHREERKRKRSLSWSTESSESSNVSKKKKKKKKHHKRHHSPPSPRVNPIFLWVKQDNTKIVEVLCEDYDKRNRIKLTKTAGGKWRAIPRTERLSRQSSDSLVNSQSSRDTKDNYESDESLSMFEQSEESVGQDVNKTVNNCESEETVNEPDLNTCEELINEGNGDDNNRPECIKHSDAGSSEEGSFIDNDSSKEISCPEVIDNHTTSSDDKPSTVTEEDNSNNCNDNDTIDTHNENVPQNVKQPASVENEFKAETVAEEFEECNFTDNSCNNLENVGYTESHENESQLAVNENCHPSNEEVVEPNKSNSSNFHPVLTEMDIYEFHDEEDEEEREIKKDIERISQERDDIYDFNEDEEFHELNDNGLDSQNIGEQVFNQEEQPANVVFRESNCSDEILKEVPQQATEDETSPRVKQEEDADESINGDLHSEISCNDSITAEIHEEHDSIDIKLDNLNEIKSDDLLNVDKDVDKKPADVQELSVSLYHRSLSKEAGDNVNSPVEEVPEASNVKDEPEDNDVNSIQPMSDVTIEEQCKLPSADKCCDRVPSSGETGLDENHNNELEPEPDRHENCLLESSNFCEEVDECVEKTIGDLIGELEERAMNRASARMAENSMGCAHSKDEHLHDAAFLGPNCTDLMDELEEMCHGIMNGRLKNYDHGSKSDLTDLYNYVPTSIDDDVSTHINESKPVICDDTHVKDIKPSNSKAETKADSPINLVVQEKVTNDLLKLENDGTQLKNCELESLDLLWRLPEGTTIHHSKVPVPSEEARPAHLHSSKNNPLLNIPKLNLYKTFVPEQEEPLNLGKPKPKEEPVVKEKHQHQNVPRAVNKTEEQPVNSLLHNSPKQVKQDKNVNDTSSKLLELLTNEEKVDPLAQLKEVLSDPNLAVPDPLLVPRERLSALIANPAKEIPRLLAQKQEVKYPKFDTDLLVVSLTHLQMMLQSSGKDEDMRLYQQHAQMLQSQLNTGKECSLDPATASMINQMLWLPYLEQLQLARSTNPQEFLAMLNNVVGYPPYSPQWTQQGYEYAQHQQMLSLWQDMMQKPNLSVPPSLSKSYNDLYKANSQTSLLPGYGQVRSNKLPPSQMTPAAATAAASARAAYPRSADVPYTSSRRPSKSSRHHSHHGMNSYLQRQQSWPMTQCTPSMIPPNSNDISRLQQANINNPYLSHSSSVKHGTQAHPSLISANAPSAASVATSSSSSVSSLLHQAVNYHGSHNTNHNNNHHHHHNQHHHHTLQDTTITPAASSTTISSANSSSSLPKLKVRDFGVDPSRRPNNLLKFGEPHFAHPGAKFPDANHPNLWHPLFSSQEGKSYSSPWQWTTPVTVSGD